MANPVGLIKKSFQEFGEDDCAMMAASLAYYTIFSLPPLLFMTVTVSGFLFGREAVEAHLLDQVRELIGPSAAVQIRTMLQQVGDRVSSSDWALLASIGALLFAATGVLVQLQAALNRAWEVQPDPNEGGIKNFLGKRIASFGALLAVAFLLLVSLVLSAAISAVGGVAFGTLSNRASEGLLHALHLTASVGLFTGVFAAIFRFLPDAQIKWRDVWIGGFITAILFTAGKFALGFYLGSSDAGENFGAAGSLAVIMLWVYYASMILLLGAEFTQVWARAHGSRIAPEQGFEYIAPIYVQGDRTGDT